MRRLRVSVAGAVALVVLGLPSAAHADRLVLTPNALLEGQIIPWEAEAPSSAFVAETVKPGNVGCGANYELDLLMPGSLTIFTSTSHVGASVRVFPTGAWTLCGWVQREGNTPTAMPSAIAGPVHFSVSGPAGTVSLSAPAIGVAGHLSVVAQYSTYEVPGEFRGELMSQLYVTATSPAQSCPGWEINAPHLIFPGGSVRAGESGSATLVIDPGSLSPGTYKLCAYLVQDLHANLALLPPTPFATASAITRVVAHASPTISGFSLTNRRFRTAAASRPGSVPRGTTFRYSLNEAATVRITLARLLGGHRVGRAGHCEAGATPRAAGERCTIEQHVTTFEVAAAEGMNSTRFSGLYGRRSLTPGSYVAIATAHSVTEVASSRVGATFTVVR